MGQTSGLAVIPSLTVGGRVFTDLSNLLQLAGNSSTNPFCTPRTHNATAGYQVPVGRTLRILAVRIHFSATTGTSGPTIGYGDTDVGQNAAAGPTNAVYLAGTGIAILSVNAALSTNNPLEASCQFDIPAGKYPFAVQAITGGATWQLFGYLI